MASGEENNDLVAPIMGLMTRMRKTPPVEETVKEPVTFGEGFSTRPAERSRPPSERGNTPPAMFPDARGEEQRPPHPTTYHSEGH